ncbi:threonine synthase [Pelomyxa schiedti]|nr:threonine synthase [Pelomyxa schiedti]
MQYVSTRGGEPGTSFTQAVVKGMAEDGGLFVPVHVPALDPHLIHSWRSLSFCDLVVKLLSLFVGGDFSVEELTPLVKKSFSSFPSNPVPLRPLQRTSPNASVGEQMMFIGELFHGPTFSFKDVALQFIGVLMEHILENHKGDSTDATVLGATSGDTGSAAIHAFKGKSNVRVFMLHPEGRVTDIQRLQMVTVMDANVYNIAIQGTFDDCQSLVKAAFHDSRFKSTHHLCAVNSINWARIAVQITYYFHLYYQFLETINFHSSSLPEVCFSVPTGNFGDVLAGFYAKQLGLPILRLVVATNANDVMHRFISTGTYAKMPTVFHTHSPAMDIQVVSNFERYLYYLSGGNCAQVSEWMTTFQQQHSFSIEKALLARVQAEFLSAEVSDSDTVETIKSVYSQFGVSVCPHTAVGIHAVSLARPPTPYVICLATAHPAKFQAACDLAGISPHVTVPNELSTLHTQPQRCFQMPCSLPELQSFIAQHHALAENHC